MCRPVYLSCPYCEFRRFFMWNECSLFWARYQYIVIDQGNFHLRPRLSRSTEDPPACGGAIQEPKIRDFELGTCPQPRCASRQPCFQPHPPLQKMLRKRNPKTLLPAAVGQDKDVADANAAASREERRRRDFADRFFIKQPVRPVAARLDGAVDDNDDDDGFYYETRREGEPTGASVDAKGRGDFSGQTLGAPAPLDLLLPCPSEELLQSCDSTMIKSGSEVESCDWEKTYQALRGLKLDSTQSI